ncbi:MAG: hypothetical protein M3460_27305 [Actinomycetota bacterium]|nr:hypothetical protein [Actinomycetota bacterium]
MELTINASMEVPAVALATAAALPVTAAGKPTRAWSGIGADGERHGRQPRR